MLQAKDVDIHKAVGVLQNTIQALPAYRDDFDQVKRTAQNLAERWGAQSEFTEIRKRRMKRHFDELSQDERLSDGESRFRINVFNASLDIINSQLSQRFTSMRETNKLLQAIHPGTLNRAQGNALHQHAQRLADHYSRDLSPSFPVQLLAFRACFKTEIAKEPSVKDMTKMLIVDHSSMAATFSEQGRCRCHSLRYAILAVDGLEELWNAVIFINYDNSYLTEEGEGERKRFKEGGSWHKDAVTALGALQSTGAQSGAVEDRSVQQDMFSPEARVMMETRPDASMPAAVSRCYHAS
ncbi:hypothetical protein JOQ06_009969 [Pogonophryne albipinna]|uniref:Uncharacterized protein n=1 Tax=Pogonophryne albipinna TaxID=1090488 RepID=A0AAD6FW96_9TELE|nr:hypothetical protein JOQ06_009969 [Pogonophryne albipinna]